MALEKTFQGLSMQMRRLRDRLVELWLTVVEDRPPKKQHKLADDFADAVDDLRGWIEEGLQSAADAEHSVGHPLDIDKARRSLVRCQEQFARIEERFVSGLASYERLDDLSTMGRERDSQWTKWTSAVRQGVDHARLQIEVTGKALTDCWQELAERVGMTTVSINSTNIGQNIVRDSAEARD
jgi:hypothetical protein